MRRALLMAAMATVPLWAAHAQAPKPDADWHRCTADTDCVIVPGICGQAAVSQAYVPIAMKYYQAQAKTARCGDQFWKPKAKSARCRLESCEVLTN